MQVDLSELAGRLRRHVEALASRPRSPGSRAHREAQDYIASHLRDAGWQVEARTEQPAGFTCTNLFTNILPVGAMPLLVIGAHYDSVLASPGADDNASAVAALLEIARLVMPVDQDAQARLQLCAYDLEEYGFIGSTLHAQALQDAGTPLLGMISLEMLGYTDARPGSQQLPPHLVGRYPDVGNFIGVCGNDDSLGLVETVAASMKTIAGLAVEWLTVPGRGESLPPIRLSDHSAFWDHGFPALMVTDTSFLRNPHYHQESDTPETLDYDFLARVTAGMSTAARRLLRG